MRVPFGTGAYRVGESVHFHAQRMVNAYLEASPPGAEVPYYVRFAHGTQTLATLGDGPIRGGGIVRGALYVVSNQTAYRVTSGGVSQSIGAIPGTGPVVVSGDETHVTFLTGRVFYSWNGSTITTVTGAPPSDWVANLDGYYVASAVDTGQFSISANRDVTSWNALDFASAEKYPDNIITGIVDHGELVLFGGESYEVWYNSGNADFPIEKVPNGHGEVGCLSVRGPAKLDNSIFFPGSDGVVYRINGYAPERISTHAIETAIRQSVDQDFRGLTWTEAGHKFYALKSSTLCVVFDVSTREWHERNSYGRETWRAAFAAQFPGVTVIGDGETGEVALLDGSAFTEFGEILRASGTCPPIPGPGLHHQLELMLEAGTGGTTSPRVMLRWSDDYGKTWSSELWRDLGAQGQYQQRTIWNRLGKAKRARIYEWSITDEVRRTLIDARLEYEPCVM